MLGDRIEKRDGEFKQRVCFSGVELRKDCCLFLLYTIGGLRISLWARHSTVAGDVLPTQAFLKTHWSYRDEIRTPTFVNSSSTP